AVLVGAFSGRVDEPVNLVNARAIADARGIDVSEERSHVTGDYTNLITARCGGREVSGTTLGRENRPWLVRVYGEQLEIELAAHMVVMENEDRPGVIGRVGNVFGIAGVNIANMNVSRQARRERAVMVLSLDTRPPGDVLDMLRALEGIHSVRLVTLNGG